MLIKVRTLAKPLRNKLLAFLPNSTIAPAWIMAQPATPEELQPQHRKKWQWRSQPELVSQLATAKTRALLRVEKIGKT